MMMELDDCITKDCSTIYRFQFASIAFICAVYLPFTFHSNIWSLYTQAFSPINCTNLRNHSLHTPVANITARALTGLSSIEHPNRSICCACNGNSTGSGLCQEWIKHRNHIQVRKATIIDEVSFEN